jgi:Domain of unknown function (DUF4390)
MSPVSTTDFFTHCWRNARLSLAGALVCIGLMTVASVEVRAQTSAADVADLRVERLDSGLYLSANLRFELSPIVEDALGKGIAMFFVAEAALLRDRWYWSDEEVAVAARHMRLAYQPLTRRWRLNTSTEPINNPGLGVSIAQNFDTLPEALTAVKRLSRWKIAEAAQVDPDARHNVQFRFRLDVTQLPRPFQIGAAGQAEWNITVSRNVRLPAEVGR